MYGRIPRPTGTALALVCALAALGLFPAVSGAATREPISLARAELRDPAAAMDAAAELDPRALAAAERGRANTVADDEVKISSTYYGADQIEAVASVLRNLDHGPELSELSVYVATPAEIAEICGATVVACYLPEQMEMVVSGVDRPVAGMPRDFAIAHEYGHHIANTQRGDLFAPIDVGTIRWATYERVCQFTRARKLFPGNQGSHYWEDPEEAFAESFARLNDPSAHVSWQYTPLLAPTEASLAKIRADVDRPWRGPVSSTVSGSLAAPPAGPARGAGSGSLAVAGATTAGTPPWRALRLVRTPLDGRVSVSLQAPAGADLALALRDRDTGAVLSHATTGSAGSAEISYPNCGHQALRLEVRSLAGAGPFQATVLRP